MEVYDLQGRIKRYASFFTLTNARGGPIEKKATLTNDESEVRSNAMRRHSDHEASDGDSQEDNHIDYPKLKVSIRHASITDFFNGKDQDRNAAIRVDGDVACLQILKACLYVFTDQETYKSCDTEDGLARYAEFTFEHLPTVDVSIVSIEERLVIAKLLLQWFRDEATVQRWTWRHRRVLSKYLLERNDFVGATHRWFRDEQMHDHYRGDPEIFRELEFMRESTTEEQLRPVAVSCARNWLLSDNWNYEPELDFLRQYLQMVR